MEGGTPFDATHKYAAMCRRLTFVISSISPSTTFTERNTQNYLRHLCTLYNMWVQEARARASESRQTDKAVVVDVTLPQPIQQCVWGKLLWHSLHCQQMCVLLGAINWNGRCVAQLPFSPAMDISSPSSRRHITQGSGYPFALHINVTFVPSLTTISLLVNDSMITGGTEMKAHVVEDLRKKISFYLQV